MDFLASKASTILKFIDFNLKKLNTVHSSVKTCIRKIENGGGTVYFFQIEKNESYSNKIASIKYSDLLEVLKALGQLKTDVAKDVASNPDYLENKYIIVDGFQFGC